MLIQATAGKFDATIGRYEGPIMAFMEKEEGDFAATSLKKDLYTVQKSVHYSESVASMTGIGDMVQTDGPVPYDEFEEGFDKTFVHKVFKKGIQIKRETVDDAKMIDMKNQSGALIDAANRTKEKFVHAPFNNINATTFSLAGGTYNITGFDGLALGAAAHTSHTGKGSNQSNITTNAFGTSSLKTAENMMKDFETDIGERANIVPDTILIPYEMRDAVFSEMNSTNVTGSANNDINGNKDKYKVIISPWLTDDDRWFLIDSKYMAKCLFWLDRIQLEIKSQVDFNTDNWMIKAYERYSLGFTDWRWIVANIPA